MRRGLFILALTACGGERMNIGYDDARLGQHPELPVDVDAANARCTGSSSGPPAPTANASPQQQLDEVAQLLVGRWYACTPSTMALPHAFELASDHEAYALEEQTNHVFVRGEKESYFSQYSSRDASTRLTLHGDTRRVTFERSPKRMSLEDANGTWLFVAF